jgi:cytochrome c553
MRITGDTSRLVLLLLVAAVFGFVSKPAASAIEVEQRVESALKLDPDVLRGGTMYAKYCAVCHGGAALGDRRRAVPALAAQRQAYLIKQFADFGALERDSEDMHAVVSRASMSEPQAWADIAAHLNGLIPQRLPEQGHGTYLELGRA